MFIISPPIYLILWWWCMVFVRSWLKSLFSRPNALEIAEDSTQKIHRFAGYAQRLFCWYIWVVYKTVELSWCVKTLLGKPCSNDCRTYRLNVQDLVTVCGLDKDFAKTGVFVPSFHADSPTWFDELMGDVVWSTGSEAVLMLLDAGIQVKR